jgi:hypothetical protein
VPDFLTTHKFWIVDRHSTSLILSQGETGIVEPIEMKYFPMRAAYVSSDLFHSNTLSSAETFLEGRHYDLLVKVPSAYDSPVQTALVFRRIGDQDINYAVNGRLFHGIKSTCYSVAMPAQNNIWETDISHGKNGAFLVGGRGTSRLWRVVNTEVDYAGRLNFTLTPIMLPNGLPSVNFTAVLDPVIRGEMEKHWSDVEDCLIRNRYYQLVTASKNVVESLLYYVLLDNSIIQIGANKDLAELLGRLKKILEDPQTESRLPFGYLDYHLMSKMRILHGSTHVGRVVASGNVIRYEMALTVVHDLIEVMRSAGLVPTP